MKLWVDDIRRCPDGWEWARTVSKAIRLLDEQNIEEVSLDHDIACYPEVGSSHTSWETYEGVARFIARMPVDRRPKIIRIHTANPIAGDRMKQILESADGEINIQRDWSFGEMHIKLRDWQNFEEEREKNV